MQIYYVDKRELAEGHHKIHIESCSELPHSSKRYFLGHFEEYDDAVYLASKLFIKFLPCRQCCSRSFELHFNASSVSASASKNC